MTSLLIDRWSSNRMAYAATRAISQENICTGKEQITVKRGKKRIRYAGKINLPQCQGWRMRMRRN